MTGFEAAAWLETRNIFLELATRQVSLPDVSSHWHYLTCCKAWDASLTFKTCFLLLC